MRPAARAGEHTLPTARNPVAKETFRSRYATTFRNRKFQPPPRIGDGVLENRPPAQRAALVEQRREPAKDAPGVATPSASQARQRSRAPRREQTTISLH